MKESTAERLGEKRGAFLDSLERSLRTPYSWGGDDPVEGFDCSGIVNEALQEVGLTPHGSDYTADGLLRLFIGRDKFVPPEAAKAGCLVFYLKGGADYGHAIATHVEAFINGWQVLGAIGGGRPEATLERVLAAYPRMADFPRFLVQRWINEHEAERRGAFVKRRPFGYRGGPFVIVDPFKPAPQAPEG